ncbi:hypothetical protein BH09CHL1_BH09CHL1_12920 [soil metagenome]
MQDLRDSWVWEGMRLSAEALTPAFGHPSPTLGEGTRSVQSADL